MAIVSRITGLAMAAAMALGTASTAQAAQTISFSGGSGSFGNSAFGVGPFTHVYTFAVPHDGFLSVLLTSTTTAPINNVNFNTTYVKLNGVTFDIVSRGVNEIRQLIKAPVLAGTQTISITGASGALGAYAGTLTFGGVPEPKSWALMIVGFGLAGAAMRRRAAKRTMVAAVA